MKPIPSTFSLKNCDITFVISSQQKNIKKLKNIASETLLHFFSGSLHKQLFLVIDEMLQNAHEHGNLEITSEVKKELLLAGIFDQTLTKRELQFGDREIKLEMQITSEMIQIAVHNEGSGFDWNSLKTSLTQSLSSCENFEIRYSGNGIPLLLKIADEFDFCDQGKKCIFKKKLTSS